MKGRRKPSKKFYDAGKDEQVPSFKRKDSKPNKRSYTKKDDKPANRKQFKPVDKKKSKQESSETEQIRLNQYIAKSGVCSRRDADELIQAGKIEVNGKVVKELGSKVAISDTVKYMGKRLNPVAPVYVLMNKPKNCICTSRDPEGRNTVIDLVKESVQERVFPVGRLDRNTTGVLLLTNDGDLSQKLTHPSSELSKIYAVGLDKELENEHLESLLTNVELEDGPMRADEISYTHPADRTQLGVRIHSGRNRIIHRMFEHLGYKVLKLDRVLFANMDKRGLKRGEFRFLTSKEVQQLKRLK
jgi:23S rRNA pseudouridine2605 synthase